MQFLAMTFAALALVPAGAHLCALPNKIGLAQEPYFLVQSIYRGWALFGVVLVGSLISDLILTIVQRHWRRPFWLALLGFAFMAASLAVFFTWTYPANQLTSNWTVAPENWQALRFQWEYAHAAGAVLSFFSFCAVALSTLLAKN